MEIRVKTGFFTTGVFRILFEEDALALCAEGGRSEFRYSELEDVTVSRSRGRLPLLEMVAGAKTVEAEFVRDSDADDFLKKLGEIAGARVRIDFRMRRG